MEPRESHVTIRKKTMRFTAIITVLCKKIIISLQKVLNMVEVHLARQDDR